MLALALMTGAANAAPVVFNYTGGFQSFTAPTTGTYNINSYGAQGGGAYGNPNSGGGLGARVGRDFSLTKGEALVILVGGMGGFGGQPNFAATPPGGGGGGSFVYTPLVGTFGFVAPPAVGVINTFTGYVSSPTPEVAAAPVA